MVITIVSYISQDDWIPWQAAEDLCVLPCDLHASVISCAAMRARPLCICCTLFRSVCVCVDEILKGSGAVPQWWSDLRVGSGPRGRRFRCCRRFLWRSSVVLTLLALLPSIFSWPLAAACPQPSLRSCPSPSTAWALMASLARTTEAACFHPEDTSRGQNVKTPGGATIQ